MSYQSCSQLSVPTLLCSIIERELEESAEFEASPHIIHFGGIKKDNVEHFYSSSLHCNSESILVPEVGKFIAGMSKLTSINLSADIGAVCLPCAIDEDGNVCLYPSLDLGAEDDNNGYFAIVDDGKELSCMLINVTGRSQREIFAVPSQLDLSASLIEDVLVAWEVAEGERAGIFLTGDPEELEADVDLFSWQKVHELHAIH